MGRAGFFVNFLSLAEIKKKTGFFRVIRKFCFFGQKRRKIRWVFRVLRRFRVFGLKKKNDKMGR